MNHYDIERKLSDLDRSNWSFKSQLDIIESQLRQLQSNIDNVTDKISEISNRLDNTARQLGGYDY